MDEKRADLHPLSRPAIDNGSFSFFSFFSFLFFSFFFILHKILPRCQK